jgi:hypothetical protein
MGKILAPLCLLTLFAFLALGSASKKSPTYDEPVHLFAGYSYLKWHDFRANPEHPPLVKALAALPLLALEIKDPRASSPHWQRMPEDRNAEWFVATRMLFRDNDAEKLFLYARLPMVGLALLLGFFVYLWAKEVYGFPAALAALIFYALDPNLLAHAPLVHTDLPFAAFFFIGSYFFCRTLERLTWPHLVLTSVFFGLAAVTKYSFVIIFPVWGLLGLLRLLSPAPQWSAVSLPHEVTRRTSKTVLLAAVLGCAAVTAYLFIWAAYLFRFDPVPGEARAFSLAQVMPERAFFRGVVSFGAAQSLLPETWIYGFLFVLKSVRRTAYLLGSVSDNGFWLYFPVAFAVKTPVSILLLLGAGVPWMVVKRRGRGPEFFLLVPVIVYFALALFSGMNIGLRHILPIYPFIFVLAGGAASALWNAGRMAVRAALLALGLWYVVSSAGIYPHYLAYFNELVGGPANGHRILTDSNLDWGQDLKGLKRWMDRHGVKRIYLAYFGTADPAYYGIEAVYLPGTFIPAARPQKKNPAKPEYVAISATHLAGVYLREPERKFYNILKGREPVATIGYSIFVYRLDSEKWP